MTHSIDTIVAPATGPGGAIAIIRLSGPRAIEIANRLFSSTNGKSLQTEPGFTLHYGLIRNTSEVVDDVLLSLFRAPHSYTGEEMVEISCHGSTYIRQEILRLCLEAGARSATAGEFTMRAFLNGKMDLAQAEAVADVIGAENRASHLLATKQIRGGYSQEFTELRSRLIEVVSLLELELDFGEEDVEFADRTQLSSMITRVEERIKQLISSFQLGNIIKHGVPVVLVGSPNVGKSTLLNALLNEDRAMVSEIAGTTRDVIEESLHIDGVLFRFSDTAGLRVTEDPLESMGIERTLQQVAKSSIVLVLVDSSDSVSGMRSQLDTVDLLPGQQAAILLNKIDKISPTEAHAKYQALHDTGIPVFSISAKGGNNLPQVVAFLRSCVCTDSVYNDEVVVFNARHLDALTQAYISVRRAKDALLTDLPGDLLSQDIREVLHHLGTITGEITTDDILGSIFSKFCIGK